MSGPGFSDTEYENLVREAITEVRSGNKAVGRRLLLRASGENPTDVRVWLWLSATTDDPQEQRDMLERALGIDPTHIAAQRGLEILTKQLGEAVPDLPELATADDHSHLDFEFGDRDEPVQATTETFDCPNCGGRMHYEAGGRLLVCEFCGFEQTGGEGAEPEIEEEPVGPALRSARGHAWAASVHEIACEKCGAHTFEPSGVKTQQCPYCGSNQLVDSKQLQELVDPQAIVLFRVQEKEAHEKARAFLNQGVLTPDDLLRQAKRLQLRPAYYPFWSFDGGVELRWKARVQESQGGGRNGQAQWREASGSSLEFFDDVLVPGVSALKQTELARIEPYNVKEVEPFEPERLAGWTALAYDRSLADASLLAREIVLKRLRPKVRSQIEPGKQKTDVRIGGASWSGVTFRHVLLPVWIGTYTYGKEEFHILVNGQTGQVGGVKPRDSFKVVGIWLLILAAVVLLIVVAAAIALQ